MNTQQTQETLPPAPQPKRPAKSGSKERLARFLSVVLTVLSLELLLSRAIGLLELGIALVLATLHGLEQLLPHFPKPWLERSKLALCAALFVLANHLLGHQLTHAGTA